MARTGPGNARTRTPTGNVLGITKGILMSKHAKARTTTQSGRLRERISVCDEQTGKGEETRRLLEADGVSVNKDLLDSKSPREKSGQPTQWCVGGYSPSLGRKARADVLRSEIITQGTESASPEKHV